MSSALDEVIESKEAQEFWARRLIGYVIDALIIFLPVMAISNIAWSIGLLGQVSWLIAGFLIVLVTAVFEVELGYTIGKRVMNLEVVSLDGRPYDIPRALIRNFTKFHPGALVLDILAGMLAENKVNMRFLDTVANCEVVDTAIAEERRARGMAPPPAGMREEAGVVVEAGAGPTMPPEPSMPPEPPAPVAAPAAPPLEDDLLQEVEEEVEEEPERAPGIAPPPIPEEPVEVEPEEATEGGADEGGAVEEAEVAEVAEVAEEAEKTAEEPPGGGWEAMEEDVAEAPEEKPSGGGWEAMEEEEAEAPEEKPSGGGWEAMGTPEEEDS